MSYYGKFGFYTVYGDYKMIENYDEEKLDGKIVRLKTSKGGYISVKGDKIFHDLPQCEYDKIMELNEDQIIKDLFRSSKNDLFVYNNEIDPIEDRVSNLFEVESYIDSNGNRKSVLKTIKDNSYLNVFRNEQLSIVHNKEQACKDFSYLKNGGKLSSNILMGYKSCSETGNLAKKEVINEISGIRFDLFIEVTEYNEFPKSEYNFIIKKNIEKNLEVNNEVTDHLDPPLKLDPTQKVYKSFASQIINTLNGI